MEILEKPISEPAARFCEDAIPKIEAFYGKGVEWRWSTKLPEGFQAQYTLGKETTPIIQLRPPKKDAAFSAVVAHEVGHLVLNTEAYPRAQSVPSTDPRLGLMLYNTMVDPEVNARVKAAGVDVEPMERLLLANVVRGLFDKKVHEPTMLDAGNSGLWTLTFLSMILKDDLGLSKEFERILNKRYSTTLQRAVGLAQEVRAAGLDSPGGCFKAMEIARERLRLQSLVLIEEGTPAPAQERT